MKNVFYRCIHCKELHADVDCVKYENGNKTCVCKKCYWERKSSGKQIFVADKIVVEQLKFI